MERFRMTLRRPKARRFGTHLLCVIDARRLLNDVVRALTKGRESLVREITRKYIRSKVVGEAFLNTGYEEVRTSFRVRSDLA